MDETTKAKLSAILTKVTGRNIENIDLNDDLKSQLELDSIKVVELFVSLEKEFNIELPLSLMNAKSGNAFLELFEEQLGK